MLIVSVFVGLECDNSLAESPAQVSSCCSQDVSQPVFSPRGSSSGEAPLPAFGVVGSIQFLEAIGFMVAFFFSARKERDGLARWTLHSYRTTYI